MDNSKEENEVTMFDRSPQDNKRSWLLIFLILIIIICVIVIIIDCSAPLSYGMRYSSGTSYHEGFIFYRNGTYKVESNYNGQPMEQEGKYSVVGSKLILENGYMKFEIVSRTRIKIGNEVLVSSASVGIIICSILLSICGVIIALWVVNKIMAISSKKEERIEELEKQVAELQAKQQDEDK